MEFDLMWQQLKAFALQLFHSMTYDEWYNLWLAGGVVMLVGLAWLANRIMRKALGHTQFRGTWYDERQFAELIQMIDEDCNRGNRVMRHDEMLLLRRWRFGDSKTYGVRQSGYV